MDNITYFDSLDTNTGTSTLEEWVLLTVATGNLPQC